MNVFRIERHAFRSRHWKHQRFAVTCTDNGWVPGVMPDNGREIAFGSAVIGELGTFFRRTVDGDTWTALVVVPDAESDHLETTVILRIDDVAVPHLIALGGHLDPISRAGMPRHLSVNSRRRWRVYTHFPTWADGILEYLATLEHMKGLQIAMAPGFVTARILGFRPDLAIVLTGLGPTVRRLGTAPPTAPGGSPR